MGVEEETTTTMKFEEEVEVEVEVASTNNPIYRSISLAL